MSNDSMSSPTPPINSPEGSLFQSLLEDRRADRRWRNIRAGAWIVILLLYTFFLFVSCSAPSQKNNEPYASAVQLTGVIAPGTSFSAKAVIPQLQKAFADTKAKGVVLLINSPGGSPVQASIIHDKIIELKKQYKKKVIVVGEDALASGAYLVATAADKIYVNPDTLTGSIGVIMNGFGFVDTMKKVGVTRRVFTAGNNKDRLDPFSELNPTDVSKIKGVLDQVHQHFIQDVVVGRGDRLKGDRTELFSGDFWTGDQAVALGIADGTKNLWTALQDEFGVQHYKDYTDKPSFIKQIIGQGSTELRLNLLSHSSLIEERAY
jgi:protease-4